MWINPHASFYRVYFSGSLGVYGSECYYVNNTNNKKEKAVTFLPYSDQENTGNWVLNTDASDEFDAKIIDEEKWYIVGKFKDGKPFYKHPDLPNKIVCAFVKPTNKIANKSEK